jgi:hypothetical protein
MATPYSAEPTIRILDEAVYNWLGNFLVDYQMKDEAGQFIVNKPNSPVLRVMAGPDRAIAQVADLLVKSGWFPENDASIARARAEYDWAVLPLPVATIERDEPTPSNLLQMSPTLFRQAFVDSQGRYMQVATPLHYVTVYRITFWSRTRYTHSHFMEWLLSQQGLPGAGPQEIYIPVNHVEPWGTILHSLRYTESANLSNLEGDDDRYIRTQVTFTLRSWMFRAFPDESRSVDQVYTLDATTADIDGNDLEPARPFRPAYSANMFACVYPFNEVATQWPTYGSASVAPQYFATKGQYGLVVTLTDDTDDRVPMAQRVTTRGTDYPVGFSITTLRYKATGPFCLAVRHSAMDGTSESVVRLRTLPATTTPDWVTIQLFSAADLPLVEWAIQSAGSASVVQLDGIDIRQTKDPLRISPKQYTTGAGYIDYAWDASVDYPYVLYGVVSAVASPVTLAAYNDAVTPTMQRTADITAADKYVGLLMSASGSTLALRCPTGVQLSRVFAVPFDGAYSGDIDTAAVG